MCGGLAEVYLGCHLVDSLSRAGGGSGGGEGPAARAPEQPRGGQVVGSQTLPPMPLSQHHWQAVLSPRGLQWPLI